MVSMGGDVQFTDGDRVATVTLRGNLDVSTAAALHRDLMPLAEHPGLDQLILDFGGVQDLESAGIALISLVTAEFESRGRKVHAQNLSRNHVRALEMMPTRFDADVDAEQPGFFERIGARAYETTENSYALSELLYDTLAMLGQAARRKRKLPVDATIEQAVLMGVDAFLIIGLLSFLLGLIMAFQSAWQLRQFGANIYVANLVGLSMVREFGPMMTAIMLAGRSGSAIAAELGTMTVQEEVDALRTMGIDPVRFLVLPRLVALTVVQPALTLMADFIGIAGGFVIGVLLLDLSTNAYFEQTVNALSMNDFWHGLLKSLVFAWIIGITGCYSGLQIRGGAASVGKATTQSVVASIFMIIVADSIFATVATLLSKNW